MTDDLTIRLRRLALALADVEPDMIGPDGDGCCVCGAPRRFQALLGSVMADDEHDDDCPWLEARRLAVLLRKGLKTFNGVVTRRIPGLHVHRRQVDVRIASPSMTAAHRAITEAGINGWSLYSMRRYWSECGETPDVLARPGVPFYRPHNASFAPLVPWDEEYPVEGIPERMREARP